MFKRKAYELLKHRKDTKHGTTPMLIEGARRVGKSALAMEFATNEYGAHLLIDFSVAPPEVIDLFRNYRHDMDAFFRYLFAYYNFTPVPRDTLIIFDEVQLCPEARVHETTRRGWQIRLSGDGFANLHPKKCAAYPTAVGRGIDYPSSIRFRRIPMGARFGAPCQSYSRLLRDAAATA